MSGVLRLVYRCLSSWVIKQAGPSRKTGQTGAVTLIQRFGSALNLNLHYHLLFLDGAYTQGDSDRLEFRRSREEAGKAVSLCEPSGGVRKALVADTKWTGALRAEDAVSVWDDWAALRHVVFSLLDFIARLVELIPKLRVNLVRYCGVFIPSVLSCTLSGLACGCSKSFLTILCPEQPLTRSGDAK